MPNVILDAEMLICVWLAKHSGSQILLGDSFYKYDPNTDSFLTHNPNSKKRRGWYQVPIMKRHLHSARELGVYQEV